MKQHPGSGVLHPRVGRCLGQRSASALGFQPRPRLAVHQPWRQRRRGICGRRGQPGWSRSWDGQSVHPTVVVEHEGGRRVSQRLRRRAGGGPWADPLVQTLPYPTPASECGQRDARRGLLATPIVWWASRDVGRSAGTAATANPTSPWRTPHHPGQPVARRVLNGLANRPPAAVRKRTPQNGRGRATDCWFVALSFQIGLRRRRTDTQKQPEQPRENSRLNSASSGLKIGVHRTTTLTQQRPHRPASAWITCSGRRSVGH